MDTLNQSNNSIPTGRFEHDSLGFMVMVQTICYGLISVFGAIGNCLFLFAMATTPQLRNPCTALIINLCFTDLLTCIVACPLAIRNNVVSRAYASFPICKMTHILTGTFAGVSILTLTVLAINRYVVIVRPHSGYRKFCQMKLVTVYSVLTWAFILPLMAIPVINGNYKVAFEYKHGCTFKGNEKNWLRGTILLTANVLLPGFILVPLLYAIMLFTVRASANRVMPVDLTASSNVGSDNTATAAATSNPVPIWRRRRQKQRFPSRRDLRLYKMPMLVLLVFSLCWAPYVIVHIIARFIPMPEGVRRLGNISVVSNSAINPYVYALSNKAIQKAYSKIFTRLKT